MSNDTTHQWYTHRSHTPIGKLARQRKTHTNAITSTPNSPDPAETESLTSHSTPSPRQSRSMANPYIGRNKRAAGTTSGVFNFNHRHHALHAGRQFCSPKARMLAFVTGTAFYTAFLYRSGGASNFLGLSSKSKSALYSTRQNIMADPRKLSIATWNVAAINNNPFEYWITIEGHDEYENLMKDVEKFLENTGDRDIAVKHVFTDDMFNALDAKMTSQMVGWSSVRTYWENDFKNRKIVSEFMKDPLLGSKRLASMPDRITNTINVVGSTEPVCRPTVINMYSGDLSTLDKWWSAWETFMFDTPLTIKAKGEVKTSRVYEMLQPIKKAKYPAITEEEETVSLPLQTLCGAIFDSILVHMMNTVSSPDIWQPLKATMVEALNKKKVPNTLSILENTYSFSDIITLQEVSSDFIDKAAAGLIGQTHHVIAPSDLDAVRDQNSVILLNKKKFTDIQAVREITDIVNKAFPEGLKVPVANGDILAIAVSDSNGSKYVIASFHGDTNGLATIPVLNAIVKAVSSDPSLIDHSLIFGLDANTYEHFKPGKTQDVMEFGSSFVSHELTSCWGDIPDAKNYTTYNARTYLQPQLNKACKSEDKKKMGDINPKDFILFPKSKFEIEQTWKDNTGKMEYIEDMAFPTLDFPSDHGILATVLKPKN